MASHDDLGFVEDVPSSTAHDDLGFVQDQPTSGMTADSLSQKTFNRDDFLALSPDEQTKYLNQEMGKQTNLNPKEALQTAADYGRGLAQDRAYFLQDEVSPAFERGFAKLLGDKSTQDYYDQLSDQQLRDTYRQQNKEAHDRSPRAYSAGILSGEALKQLNPIERITSGAGGAVSAAISAAGANEGDLAQRTGWEKANPDETLVERGLKFAAPVALGGILPTVVKNPGTVTRAVAGTGLGIAATPIIKKHPTAMNYVEGGLLGLGAGLAGPKILNETAAGKALKEGFKFGKEGESLLSSKDLNRVQGEANTLSNEVGQGVSSLTDEVANPAMQKIQGAFDDSLKAIGEKLNLKGEELSNFIEANRMKAGESINQAWTEAQAQGKTLDISDFLGNLKSQLEDTITNGLVPDEQGQQTVQNLVKSVNDRMVKKGVPIQIDETTILDSSGEPFLKSAKIGGKDVDLGALPQQTPEGNMVNKNASVERTVVGPDSDNPLLQTTMKQSRVLTPEEPKGPLEVPELRQLKGFLGANAFENNSVPEQAKNILSGGYRELNKILAPVFQEGEANAFTSGNEKYTAIKQIGDIIGEPIPDRITGEKLPPQMLQNIIGKIGNVVKQGDRAKFDQIFKNLEVIDPAEANAFKQSIESLSGHQADLTSSVNKSPLEKLDILKGKGATSPELNEAGQQIRDVESLQKQIGGLDETKLNAEGVAQPSDKTRNFIKDIGDTSSIGATDDVKASINLLRKYKPQVAEKLETQGEDVASKLRLLGVSDEKLPIYTRAWNAAKTAPGKIGNVAGLAVNKLSNPYLEQVSDLIRLNAPIVMKYKEPLANAASRGAAALAAANFAISQKDPEYRQQVDQFNQEYGR
jgi:hypothetical protein